MVDIRIGERVIGKRSNVGTIISVDTEYIAVDFGNETKTYQINSFTDGYLKFEDSEKQILIDQEIVKIARYRKITEEAKKRRKEEEDLKRQAEYERQAKIAERKKLRSLNMKDLIIMLTGNDYYTEYLYVKEKMKIYGRNLTKILSKDYILFKNNTLTELSEIKCTETSKEILYIYRYYIYNWFRDDELADKLLGGVYGEEDFFTKKQRIQFCSDMASFGTEDNGMGLAAESFDGPWNELIRFCCQAVGDDCINNKDFDSAFKYYSKEAELYIRNTPWLGELYLKGLGTKKNIGIALHCLFRESLNGCYYVQDLDDPYRISKEPIPEQDFFNEADKVSEQMKNDYIFCYYFARMLSEGVGTKVNLERALEFAKQADYLVSNEIEPNYENDASIYNETTEELVSKILNQINGLK